MFKCTYCEYTSKLKYNLNRHINSKHLGIKTPTIKKDKVFLCQECSFKTTHQIHLTNHINEVHNKIKGFKCTLCDYSTYRERALKQHIDVVHNKIKTFKCPYDCGYKAHSQSRLNRHLNSCDGTKNNKSGGEKKIEKYLNKYKILYEYNTSYKVKNIKLLKWDFIVNYKDEKRMIEFNGRQHYQPIQYGNQTLEEANNNFIRQKENDRIKSDFCKENDIKLLWIPYWEFNTIDKLLDDFFDI